MIDWVYKSTLSLQEPHSKAGEKQDSVCASVHIWTQKLLSTQLRQGWKEVGGKNH